MGGREKERWGGTEGGRGSEVKKEGGGKRERGGEGEGEREGGRE